MKNVRKIGIIVAFIFLVNIFLNNIYAATDITKENLSDGIKKFFSSFTDENDEDMNLEVTDDEIIIKSDGEESKINYELAEKIKFTVEVEIKQGMSYADFKKQTEDLNSVILGYISVAMAKGVSLEAATMYFIFSGLNNLNISIDENSYIVIEENNVSEGVTISGNNIIQESEFPNRVMEYVNAVYKENQVISDSSEEDGEKINSYEWVVEKRDVKDDSCKMVSTLTIDNDADFLKINDIYNQILEDNTSNQVDKTNDIDDGFNQVVDIQTNSTGEEKSQQNTDNLNQTSKPTAKENLPKTGVSNAICIAIVVVLIIVITYSIKLKKNDDIK